MSVVYKAAHFKKSVNKIWIFSQFKNNLTFVTLFVSQNIQHETVLPYINSI